MPEKVFNDQTPLPPEPSPPVAANPRRKRRLVLKILAAVVAVLILLVASAPTLLSTRPILSIVLGQVNDRLNGQVEVSSLSLGWFSGIDIRGIRVLDGSNAQIAQLDRLTVPLPLWKAILGKLALGDVVCDGLSADARFDADHRLNFTQLIKQSPAPAGPAPANQPPATGHNPSKPPSISGDIKLTNCRLSVSQFGKPTVYVSKMDGEIKIPDINGPITDSLSLTGRTGDEPEGSFSLSFNSVYHGGGAIPDLRSIDLKVSSKSINGEFTGDSLADLNGTLNADLTAASGQLRPFLPGDKANLAGNVAVKITTTGQSGQSHLALNVTGTNLQYTGGAGSTVDEPLVLLDLSAQLSGTADAPVESVQNLSLTLKTGDANSPALDLLAVSPSIDLGTEPAANFHLTHFVADLARLQKQFAAIGPNASGAIVNQGVLTVAGQGLYKNHVLSLDGLTIGADNLVFTQQTADGKQSPAVTAGSLQAGGSANVDLTSAAAAKARLKLAGDVADLTRVLAAYQGKSPDAYPYRGQYTLDETVQSNGSGVGLAGGIQIAKFQALRGDAVTFSEDLLALTNDVGLKNSDGDQSITIASASVSMNSSGALNLALKDGAVDHLQSTRDLHLRPTVDYDLAKLWPIVQPMMGDQYKALKITGQFNKQFNLTGSYPAGQPSRIAIKSLHADGDLAVASLDYDGLSLQNFIVPFTMDDGKLATVYAGKPTGHNTAAPAAANGGTLDLGNITVDLTQVPPRLSAPANKTVVSGLAVNQIFANTILTKLLNNPIFTGANASGLFDLTLVDCDDLPLGGLIDNPANAGKADLKFSLTDFHIGFDGISGMASALKADGFTANVKDATDSIAKGLSTEHVSFVTGPYSIDFDGTVRLSDQALVPLNASIGPLAVLAQKSFGIHDQKTLSRLPARFVLPVKGTVTHARVASDQLAKEILKVGAETITKGSLGGLLKKLEKDAK